MTATTGEINGSILKIFTDTAGTYTAFGNITSCSIKMDVDTIETTSKSSGGHKSFIAGEDGWSMDLEMILEEDASVGAGERSYQDAMSILQAKTAQTVAWGSGISGDLKVTGSVIFQNVTINAPKNAVATASVTMMGTGIPTVGTFA